MVWAALFGISTFKFSVEGNNGSTQACLGSTRILEEKGRGARTKNGVIGHALQPLSEFNNRFGPPCFSTQEEEEKRGRRGRRGEAEDTSRLRPRYRKLPLLLRFERVIDNSTLAHFSSSLPFSHSPLKSPPLSKRTSQSEEGWITRWRARCT